MYSLEEFPLFLKLLPGLLFLGLTFLDIYNRCLETSDLETSDPEVKWFYDRYGEFRILNSINRVQSINQWINQSIN